MSNQAFQYLAKEVDKLRGDQISFLAGGVQKTLPSIGMSVVLSGV